MFHKGIQGNLEGEYSSLLEVGLFSRHPFIWSSVHFLDASSHLVISLQLQLSGVLVLLVELSTTKFDLFYFCSTNKGVVCWVSKGPFTQAIFVAATRCNSMQFLSRRSCNQLRFNCDFSAICQCKRQYTSIP